MRPAIAGNDTHRKRRVQQKGIKRIVMRHRRHAAQQIFDRTEKQTLIARHRTTRNQFGVRPQTRCDIGDPVRAVVIALAIAKARKAIEMQVIVGVDQAGQNAIATQIDAQVARLRLRVHRDDAPAREAQCRAPLGAEPRIEQYRIADYGRHGPALRARIANTMGRPRQRR